MVTPNRTAPSTTGHILRRNRGFRIKVPSHTHTRRKEGRRPTRPQERLPSEVRPTGVAGTARGAASTTNRSSNYSFPNAEQLSNETLLAAFSEADLHIKSQAPSSARGPEWPCSNEENEVIARTWWNRRSRMATGSSPRARAIGRRSASWRVAGAADWGFIPKSSNRR
jgi:hypothetical protein